MRNKKYCNGLIVMKAYPPHMGHFYLIDKALEYCHYVYVMVCSLQREDISGELRYEWVRDYYKDNPSVIVIHIKDENPQYPSECNSVNEFYDDYWIPTVYKNIPTELDAVFTSEDYGDEFAKYLGVKHVLIDKERLNVPISGTLIRNNPYKYWDFISDNVKRYFMKRVVIMGTESTGKSTLTRKLAEYFNTSYIKEYGRTYTDVYGTKDLQVIDFENIAVGHNDIINQAGVQKIIFVDTEAMTTKIFGEMYIPEFKSELIEEIIEKQHFDLYLLLDIDVPWVDDGTRDFPNRRKWHFNRLKRELDSRGIKYVVISGSYDERFNKAIKEIENMRYLL